MDHSVEMLLKYNQKPTTDNETEKIEKVETITVNGKIYKLVNWSRGVFFIYLIPTKHYVVYHKILDIIVFP